MKCLHLATVTVATIFIFGYGDALLLSHDTLYVLRLDYNLMDRWFPDPAYAYKIVGKADGEESPERILQQYIPPLKTEYVLDVYSCTQAFKSAITAVTEKGFWTMKELNDDWYIFYDPLYEKGLKKVIKEFGDDWYFIPDSMEDHFLDTIDDAIKGFKKGPMHGMK